MTQPIGELTDRMREIFGLVVEAYLERGLPVGSKALAGSVSLSPASIRGVMQELEERGLLTHPHTSAGRIPTESGLRLFVDGIMQAAAPDPRERREIERQIARDQPIEDALAAASAALSGLSPCGRRGAGAEARAAPQAAELRAAERRAGRWRCWSAPTAASRTASCRSTAGTSAAALTEVSNFVNARLSGLTLGRSRGAAARRNPRAQGGDRRRRGRAGRLGPCRLEPGPCPPPGADRPRPGQSDRRRPPPRTSSGSASCSTSSRTAQEIARLLEGARDAPGCRIFIGSENRMFALSGSSVIAAPYRGSQGRGGRRCRRDRPDAVELCARGPHGGFHRAKH